MFTALTIGWILWAGALINLLRWGKLNKFFALVVGFAAVFVIVGIFWTVEADKVPIDTEYLWSKVATGHGNIYLFEQKDDTTVVIYKAISEETEGWGKAQWSVRQNYFGLTKNRLDVPPFLERVASYIKS